MTIRVYRLWRGLVPHHDNNSELKSNNKVMYIDKETPTLGKKIKIYEYEKFDVIEFLKTENKAFKMK